MRSLWLPALLASLLCGQEPQKSALPGLDDADPVRAELARRGLCATPPAALPIDALRALAAGTGASAERARSVLRWHGLLPPDAGLLGVPPAELVAVATSGRSDAAARALRWLVFAVSPLPEALLAAADGDPNFRSRLLEVLAERPRQGAATHVRRWLAAGDLQADEQLQALAALPPGTLSLAQARTVWAGLADPGRMRWAQLAAARLGPAVADQLVPEIGRQLLGSDAEAAVNLHWLTAITPAGAAQLFEQVFAAAAPKLQESICTWCERRAPDELARRVQAALDGQIGLAPALLDRAGPHLDTTARQARVAALLRSPQRELALTALSLLLRARIYLPAMLDLTLDESARTRELELVLALGPQLVPATAYARCLADPREEVVALACRALAAPGLPPALEATLRALATGPEGAVAASARRTLLVFGSDESAKLVYAACPGPEDRAQVAALLAERPRAWTMATLLATLGELRLAAGPAGPEGESWQAEIELLRALVRLGHAPAVATLIARTGDLEAAQLRALRDLLVPALEPEHVRHLLALLDRREAPLTPARRRELAIWLARRPDLAGEAALTRLRAHDRDPEVQLEALRGLLRTGARDRVREEVAGWLAGQVPGSEASELVAYEVLGMAEPPVPEEALVFAARLALLAPLAVPYVEIERALAPFPQGLQGAYNELFPIVDLVRRADPVTAQAAFRSVAAQVRAHPQAHALGRVRVVTLMAQLAAHEAVFAAVGPVLAELALAIPEADTRWAAPCELVLVRAAERRGDHAFAAQAYARALAAFVRWPHLPSTERAFLGEEDPWSAEMPLAALAAKAHLCAARAALHARDLSAARRELALAEDLGLGDAACTREAAALARELSTPETRR